MGVTDKRIIVNLPTELYESIKRIAEKKYRSVSSLIRESISEKIEEEFTPEEMALIEKGRKSLHEGKGINWRKVIRSLEEIKKIINEHKSILKEKFKVSSIGVFGSYVRKEEQEKSDIDILVGFYEVIDLFKFIELEDFLSKILGVKVDLVMKETLKPRIKDRILKEAIYI